MFHVAQNQSKADYLQANGLHLARLQEQKAKTFVQPVLPANETYAKVRSGGHVVATISNNGYVRNCASFGRRFSRNAVVGAEQGPKLAEQRARALAVAYGGEVEYAATALSQAEWEALPAVVWKADSEALQRHGIAITDELLQLRFTTRERAVTYLHEWFDLY